MGRIVAQNMAWWGCHVEHTQNSNKKNKRKEKGWGVWPRLSAPCGSWVLRCGCCPFPFAQEGCRPSVLSMAIPAILGNVDRQEGSTIIVFDVVFPSMGSDRRDYCQILGGNWAQNDPKMGFWGCHVEHPQKSKKKKQKKRKKVGGSLAVPERTTWQLGA